VRKIAILEQVVCHKTRGASAEAEDCEELKGSAAKLVDDPENDAEEDADDDAGDQRKVESGALAAMDDVAGQASEAEGKFGSEVEERADDDENRAEDEEGAAELLVRFHGAIVKEAREAEEAKEVEEVKEKSWTGKLGLVCGEKARKGVQVKVEECRWKEGGYPRVFS